MRLRFILATLATGLIGAAQVGCVAQDVYDDTAQAALALETRNAELAAQIDQQDERYESTLDALNREQAAGQAKDREITALNTQIDQLRTTLGSLDRQVRDLSTSSTGVLDPRTEMALQSLADRYPGLLSFDSARGMIQVAADLTFASGSANVQESAGEAISAIASVLEDVAAAYDVRVEGHTDSQLISNPDTKRRFPTNRHLSVARAIAVSESLQRAGVSGTRILVAGWGPHRPIVMNNERGGTAENRRVEIFLVQSTEASELAPAGSTSGQSSREDAAPETRTIPVK